MDQKIPKHTSLPLYHWFFLWTRELTFALVYIFLLTLNWLMVRKVRKTSSSLAVKWRLKKAFWKFSLFISLRRKEFECWTFSQECPIFWIQLINCLLEIIKAFVLKIIGVIENKGFNLGSRFNLSAPIHLCKDKRNHVFFLSLLRLLIISLNIQQISWVMDV